MIHGHGNNIYDFDKPVVIDFSSNVFNNPCTTHIVDYLKEEVNCIRNYPDCTCMDMRAKLAELYGLSIGNLLICNGSTESFYLLAHAFINRKSVIPIPSFSEYEDACNLYNHSIEFVSNKVNLNEQDLNDKIVWIGNPNNPDGIYHTKGSLVKLISSNPNTIFIIDEAYIDLCKDGETIVGLVNRYSNLAVIKSFTKLYAVPGIRLGYVAAHPTIIEKLLKLHMPWAVNALALKLGEYILGSNICNNIGVNQLLEDTLQFQEEIAQIPGLSVIPSSTNYFLVEMGNNPASELKQYLMEKHGYLIRDAANFRGLNENWFRLASQGRDNDIKLINALKEYF